MIFLRMLILIMTAVIWSAPALSQPNESYQLAYCSGCGCKGGPGWRIHKSGRCASNKNIAKECGNPPSTARCTNELAGNRFFDSNTTTKQQFLPAPKKGVVEDIHGRATVIDADTIEIHGERIRIFGVDAPEGKQLCKNAAGNDYRCGQIGSIALATYLDQSQPIRCEYKDRDRYDRFVGQCFTAAGNDIAEWLAREGHALDYRQYSNGKYASAEREARANKAGIWQGSFIEPWEWRRGKR